MAEDDWESEFLSTRHVHNRGTRKSGGEGARKQTTFDVRKTFGSYELKCAAADRYMASSQIDSLDTSDQKPRGRKGRDTKAKQNEGQPHMEIYRMTDDMDGLLGELIFPGLLDVGIILAATKKGLEELASQHHHTKNDQTSENPSITAETTAPQLIHSDYELQSDSGDSDERYASNTSTPSENKERRRFENFEKNSFRQPKFWLWWKGNVHSAPDTSEQAEQECQSGMGYVVFSGNTCKRFGGTLSCEMLGWNDVTISGRKICDIKERDVAIL